MVEMIRRKRHNSISKSISSLPAPGIRGGDSQKLMQNQCFRMKQMKISARAEVVQGTLVYRFFASVDYLSPKVADSSLNAQ